MSVKNSTIIVGYHQLYELVRRAVDHHFSNVLDIDSLVEDKFLRIKTITIYFQNDSENALKIYEKFIEYPELGGSVESGQGSNPFNTYGELKKAIRNGILQIREKKWMDNNSNINNNYKMS